MSIQRMRRRFAVHLRYVLYAIIGVFIVGLPFMFTPGLSRRREDESQKGAQDIIARVNGEALRRPRLEQQFKQTMGQIAPIYQAVGRPLGLSEVPQLRLQAFEDAVTAELLLRQAEAQGLSVSGRDVAKETTRIADQQIGQIKEQYQGEQLKQVFAQIVSQNEGRPQTSMSERAFRKWLIDQLTAEAESEIRDNLVSEKLRQKATASVSTTEDDLLANYDRVTVREIVVSLRPSGKPERTKDEAKKRAEDLLTRARQGADFGALADAESDVRRADATGGLRGPVLASSMAKEWRQAVSALKPGEISPLIEGAARYTIVKLEKRERELPKEFEKNKPQLLANLVRQRQEEAWQDYITGLRKQATVEAIDPEILAYRALGQAKLEEALAGLRKASAQAVQLRGIVGGAIYYNLATMLAQEGQWKDAADNYSAAVDTVSQEETYMLPDARAEALMGLARASEHLGKPDDALLWYQEASTWSDTPPLHEELLTTYERLGKPDLVTVEQQWLAQYEEAQQERRKAMEEQQKRDAASKTSAPTAVPQAP